MVNGYEKLANAIVEQAAKDYRKARKLLAKDPFDIRGLRLRQETERFFCSDWIGVLTAVSGEMILNMLEEEFEK